MKFSLRWPFVADVQQQEVNEDLLAGINTIGQFLFTGSGAPSFTPPGPAIYLRTNGGATTTLYVYDVTAPGWTAK